MFPMTMTIHTPAQLSAVLAALQPDLQASDFRDPSVGRAYEEVSARVAANAVKDKPAPEASAQSAAVTPEKQAAARASTKKVPTTPAADALAEKDADTAEALAGDTRPDEITYEAVKPLILKLAQTKGRAAAEGALKKFDAVSGQTLDKAHYGAFVAHANELLAA